jgi:hypothetical protein
MYILRDSHIAVPHSANIFSNIIIPKKFQEPSLSGMNQENSFNKITGYGLDGEGSNLDRDEF